MKKSLIAIAALASVSAYAQSTVTITGVFDLGYRQVAAPFSTSTKGGFQNGTATSAILIQGEEDLGGGLKANFRYEINPDLTAGAGLSGNVLASGTTSAMGSHGSTNYVRTSNGANGYNFVGVSGGFGGVKFGRLNTGTLATWGIGSVFGTALGSGYGTNGNMLTRDSSTVANFNQTAPTRFNNAVEYTSPTMNGLTGRILYVPKVDGDGLGSTDSTTATIPGVNRAGVTDMSLAYNNGPLNAGYSIQSHKYPTTLNHAVVSPGGSSAVVGGDYKLTTIAVNYNIGALTLYGAQWTEVQQVVAATAVKLDATGNTIGAKYALNGNIDLMVNQGRRNDKSTTDIANTAYSNRDQKILGLGADYKLSKRTALWARYENKDPDTNRSGVGITATATTDATKTTAIGIRHSF